MWVKRFAGGDTNMHRDGNNAAYAFATVVLHWGIGAGEGCDLHCPATAHLRNPSVSRLLREKTKPPFRLQAWKSTTNMLRMLIDCIRRRIDFCRPGLRDGQNAQSYVLQCFLKQTTPESLVHACIAQAGQSEATARREVDNARATTLQ